MCWACPPADPAALYAETSFGQLACRLKSRDRRFEVEPGLLVQSVCASDQVFQRDVDFVAGRGKRDRVTAIA